MRYWLRDLARDFWGTLFHLGRGVGAAGQEDTRHDRQVRLWGLLSALLFITLALIVGARTSIEFELPDIPHAPNPPRELPDLTQPVRKEPKRFAANTYRPKRNEGAASGSIPTPGFSAAVDLIPIHDDRVWWESEHDTNDTENDHLFHYAMEEPMRRLFELVHREGALLKVQDAYRDEGIHSKRSLHKEGRAVDLTADGMSLERLAKLCWAAGFDWVFFESPKRGGAHIHASVRADRPWVAAAE